MNKDMRKVWHLYDQGLLNRLKKLAPTEAENFIDKLCNIIGIDLFSDGFKAVSHGFCFLEAIGATVFQLDKTKIKREILQLTFSKLDGPNNLTAELPLLVKNVFFEKLRLEKKLAPELLLKASKEALNPQYTLNPVIAELLEYVIGTWKDELKSAQADAVHDQICHLLAIEYALQFPYFEFLVQIYPNVKERKHRTNEIYHALFIMAADAVISQENISYFRCLDAYRKNCLGWSGESDDAYKQCNAQLQNNKDLLDSYVIHVVLIGYFFNSENYRVAVFTLENPATMRARVTLGKEMLKLISEAYPVDLNAGIIYCFNEQTLESAEIIDIEKIP
jgi:hypothetical protein